MEDLINIRSLAIMIFKLFLKNFYFNIKIFDFLLLKFYTEIKTYSNFRRFF